MLLVGKPQKCHIVLARANDTVMECSDSLTVGLFEMGINNTESTTQTQDMNSREFEARFAHAGHVQEKKPCWQKSP
jgi:hypothetical protein